MWQPTGGAIRNNNQHPMKPFLLSPGSGALPAQRQYVGGVGGWAALQRRHWLLSLQRDRGEHTNPRQPLVVCVRLERRTAVVRGHREGFLSPLLHMILVPLFQRHNLHENTRLFQSNEQFPGNNSVAVFERLLTSLMNSASSSAATGMFNPLTALKSSQALIASVTPLFWKNCGHTKKDFTS